MTHSTLSDTSTVPALLQRESDPTGYRCPLANAATVRDPDWIAARLRLALAADYPDYHLRELLAEVSTWTADADATAAAITQRTHLPKLEWHRETKSGGLRGHQVYWMPSIRAYLSEFEFDDCLAVATAWATELRLIEPPVPTSPGTREWVGTIEGWHVEIWIMTDRNAFEDQ